MLNVTGWPAAADVLAAHQLKNFRIAPETPVQQFGARTADQLLKLLTNMAAEASAMTP